MCTEVAYATLDIEKPLFNLESIALQLWQISICERSNSMHIKNHCFFAKADGSQASAGHVSMLHVARCTLHMSAAVHINDSIEQAEMLPAGPRPP